MDFGKVELSRLDQIDFTLPPLSEPSILTLGGKEQKKFRLSLGAPVWSVKEWEGKVYPPRTSSSKYLEIYSQVFNCIELNTTFYRTPDVLTVDRWKRSVPSGFLFYPKLPQEVSHSDDLAISQRALQHFISVIRVLDRNLGVSFLQLPPHFSFKDFAYLKALIDTLPSDFELAIEFRHPSFFENNQVIPVVQEALSAKKISILVTDTAGRRDVLHQTLTTQKVLIRFLGNELHPTDFTRLNAWMERVEMYKKLGAREVAFFAHLPTFHHIPELAEFWVREWNSRQPGYLLPEIRPPQLEVTEDLQLSLF